MVSTQQFRSNARASTASSTTSWTWLLPVCVCALAFQHAAVVDAKSFHAASKSSFEMGKMKASAASATIANHRQRRQRQQRADVLDLRGGQSSDPNNYPNYDDGINYDDGSNYYENEVGYAPPTGELPSRLPQDTVQDRVEAWRTAQKEQSESMSVAQRLSQRDDQGRIKLMSSLGKGGRAAIFFIMMMRDIHFFELAEQQFKSMSRAIVMIPLAVLFLCNLSGTVVSWSSPKHSTKKRLKAILNLNKIMEMGVIVWNFLRMTIVPSQHIPREYYIARMLHALFFLLQCQGCTRLNWDDAHVAMTHSDIMGQASHNDKASTTYGPVSDNAQHFMEERWDNNPQPTVTIPQQNSYHHQQQQALNAAEQWGEN